MTATDFIYMVVGFLVLLILVSLYRRREFIAQRLRWFFVAFAAYLLTILIVRQFTQDPIKAFLAAVIVELIVMIRTKPNRSRYIPRGERRKAIARYERTGKRFDPRKHHLDHVVPYSRGGSNRADNLRVKDRDENLAKSDRSPWWDVFGRQ